MPLGRYFYAAVVLTIGIDSGSIPEDVQFMERGAVFKRNRSHAVRRPKVAPGAEAWRSWFDQRGVSNDFMRQREQPAAQK